MLGNLRNVRRIVGVDEVVEILPILRDDELAQRFPQQRLARLAQEAAVWLVDPPEASLRIEFRDPQTAERQRGQMLPAMLHAGHAASGLIFLHPGKGCL